MMQNTLSSPANISKLFLLKLIIKILIWKHLEKINCRPRMEEAKIFLGEAVIKLHFAKRT
jgi:hypothetical protein